MRRGSTSGSRNRLVRLCATAALAVLVSLAGDAARIQATTGTDSLRLYAVLTHQAFVNNSDDRERGQGHNPFGNATTAPARPTNEKVFGPFAGDEGQYTFSLSSDADHRSRVGTASFVCQYDFDEGSFCDATFQLGHGTLLAKGGFGFEATKSTLAVEGGTAAYRNMVGVVDITALGQASQPQPVVRNAPMIQSQRLAFTLTKPLPQRAQKHVWYSNVTNEVFVNNDDDEARGAVNNPFGIDDAKASAKDESGSGPFPGDEALFEFGMFSSSKLDTDAGSGVYTCEYSFAKTAFCNVTFELDGGTLDGDGTLDFGAHSWALTITGGTGRYAGLSGEVDAAPSGRHAQRLTFTLS
jgi:hypothetical protein